MELLVTLMLASMVAAWAVPGLSRWWSGLRVTAANNHFVGMLEVMRYRSLALHVPVTICGSQDGVRCHGDHGTRILMFQDGDRDGAVDEGERVLGHDPFVDDKDFWLVWRAFQSKGWLRWASGRTDSMNGTFTVCNAQRRNEWLRQVVVNRAGRARVVVPVRAGASVVLAARKACGWG